MQYINAYYTHLKPVITNEFDISYYFITYDSWVYGV